MSPRPGVLQEWNFEDNLVEGSKATGAPETLASFSLLGFLATRKGPVLAPLHCVLPALKYRLAAGSKAVG